jgi:predicted transcriptional regulator
MAEKHTVTISVSGLQDARARLAAAFEGQAQEPRITFATIDLMWRTLTPRRQELLQAMAGHEAMSIRAAARLVGRDVKAVHGDVQALLSAGVLQSCEGVGVVFPYDGLHVLFDLKYTAVVPGEASLESAFDWGLGRYPKTNEDPEK